jgi:hypothetical protein
MITIGRRPAIHAPAADAYRHVLAHRGHIGQARMRLQRGDGVAHQRARHAREEVEAFRLRGGDEVFPADGAYFLISAQAR